MIPLRNPIVRRVALVVAAALLGAGVLMGWRAASRPPLEVQLVEVTGFNENVQIWMPLTFALDIRNITGRTIGIDRIDVEPDLDGFNEAYNSAVPVLSAPLIVEGDTTTRYDARVMLLNANQLQEGTHPVVFRVRLETEDDGEVTAEFAGTFEYSRDPQRRRLTLPR